MDDTTNRVLTKILVFLSINPALNDDGLQQDLIARNIISKR